MDAIFYAAIRVTGEAMDKPLNEFLEIANAEIQLVADGLLKAIVEERNKRSADKEPPKSDLTN